MPKEPIEGKFAASIVLDASRFGKQDIDNSKCLLDYLEKRANLIRNDRDCFSYTITWGNADGGCTVTIVELSDA